MTPVICMVINGLGTGARLVTRVQIMLADASREYAAAGVITRPWW